MKNLIILSVIIISFCSIIVSGAVIGIDFGNHFFKISLISPGKSLLIVENITTKRKTNTAVAFLEKEKVYETDAASKKLRNPQNSFSFIQKFLGVTKADKAPFDIAKKYFDEYKYVYDPERETVQFEINNFAGIEDGTTTVVLSVEQIVAIILKYGKYLSEKFGKVDIKDCVLTVPPHWNVKQRFQLIQAIELASLHPLALISENTAAALYYAIDRYDENSTFTAIIYNVGSYNLQVSLVQYHTVNNTQKANKRLTETLKVLADYSEPDLGSLNFDLVLANIFTEEIDAKPNRKGKPSIRENKKAMLKLLSQCNRVKEVLSANKDAAVYIENLIDGLDFKFQITRQQFEEKSSELIERMLAPIDIVLKKAGLTMEQIEAVEIIGGGVRVPKLQQALSQKVGKELGQHLNGDEAMALGASFMAANYSHSFKVRDIWLDDGFNFEIFMKISNLNPVASEEEKFNKSLTLYPFKKRFGTKKQISFSYDKDLQIEMFIKNESGAQELFAQYNLTNISNLSNHEWFKEFGKPKIYLDFELNSLDVIFFEAADIRVNRTEQYETLEDEKRTIKPTITPVNISNDTNSNTTSDSSNNTTESSSGEGQQQSQSSDSTASGDSENKESSKTEENTEDASNKDASSEQQQTEEQKEEPAATSETTNSETTNSEANNATSTDINNNSTNNSSNSTTDEIKQEEVEKQKKQPKKPKKVKKIRKRTNLISIPIDIKEYLNIIPPLNDTEFKKQINFLKKLDETELLIKKRAEAKNKLESFIYQVRDIMAEELFQKASTEAERLNLTQISSETDEWLQSDEGFNSKLEVYTDRYNNMSARIKPIIKRLEESKKRPEAINKTMQKIEEYIKKVEKLNVTMPWIKPKDKAPLYSLINKTITWLKQVVEEQEKKPLYEDPAFLVDDILPKMDQIRRSFVALKNTKKPPKKTKLNSTLTTNGTATNNTNNETLNTNKTADGESANQNVEDTQQETDQAETENKDNNSQEQQQQEENTQSEDKSSGEQTTTSNDKDSSKKSKEDGTEGVSDL